MTIPRATVHAILARRIATPAPKARRKVGTGSWAVQKAWVCRMRCEPGIFLAVRTVTEKNSGGHWAVKAKRAGSQRESASMAVWAWFKGGGEYAAELPIRVTLTRYGPRLLDADNAVSALAHLRDGIADAFGVDDAAGSGIDWIYAEQVKSPAKCYGVRILIQPKAKRPTNPNLLLEIREPTLTKVCKKMVADRKAGKHLPWFLREQPKEKK